MRDGSFQFPKIQGIALIHLPFAAFRRIAPPGEAFLCVHGNPHERQQRGMLA